MKLIIIAITLILFINSSNSAFFARTEWWPGCKCGEVTWQTQYTTKEACNIALCKTYFFRSEWWPGCKCGLVSWQSPYESEGDCLRNMCEINYEQQWQTFQQQFNKQYATEAERQQRFQIFRDNFQRIEAHNEGDSNFTLGISEYSDKTDVEIVAERTGLNLAQADSEQQNVPSAPAGDLQTFPTDDQQALRETETGLNSVASDAPSAPSAPSASSVSVIKATLVYDYVVVDWRKKNAVTAVKNQGACGSCYVFSAVGALEGLWSISNVGLHRFSEKQVLDCHYEGCGGGWMYRVFNYTRSNGINTEDEYPKLYNAVKQTCSINAFYQRFRNTGGWQFVPNNDVTALMNAVRQQPVSIALCASWSWQNYKSGIYDDASCTCGQNHAVLAVGYGYELRYIKIGILWLPQWVPYWIIKNSWGVGWGDQGYIKMKITTGQGICKMHQNAHYPTL